MTSSQPAPAGIDQPGQPGPAPATPASASSPGQPGRPSPIKVLPGRVTPSSPTRPASPAGPVGSPGSGGAQLPPDPLGNIATPSSSGRPAASGPRLDKRVWQDILRGLFQQLGDLLHDRLATLPADREAQVWRADQEDAAAVTDPLANVVHRRVSVPGGADVADLVTAGAALAGYSIRNLRQMMTNRRARRRMAQAGIAEPEPDQPPAQP